MTNGQSEDFRVYAENSRGIGPSSTIVSATPYSSSCGFDIPPTLNFEDLLRNSDGIEVNNIFNSTGTATRTLELLTKTNWLATSDSEMHLFANATKYNLTTDGSDSSGTSYASKTAIGEVDETILLADVAANIDLDVTFQLSGIDTLQNLPFSGAMTQELTFTITC